MTSSRVYWVNQHRPQSCAGSELRESRSRSDRVKADIVKQIWEPPRAIFNRHVEKVQRAVVLAERNVDQRGTHVLRFPIPTSNANEYRPSMCALQRSACRVATHTAQIIWPSRSPPAERSPRTPKRKACCSSPPTRCGPMRSRCRARWLSIELVQHLIF
jgi:hypothetical protein